MGRSRAEKTVIIEQLKKLLSESQITLIIDYQGLTVSEIGDLRSRLRPLGTTCKVTKNTFMELAIQEDANWQAMKDYLSGPSAFLLVKDDIGASVKAYQAFQKEVKKTEFRVGIMQGKALTEADVKAIADLPPKEVLMAQLAGALKAVPTKLAVAINAVPTGLARGINEVPASLGRAIAAIAQKEDSEAA